MTREEWIKDQRGKLSSHMLFHFHRRWDELDPEGRKELSDVMNRYLDASYRSSRLHSEMIRVMDAVTRRASSRLHPEAYREVCVDCGLKFGCVCKAQAEAEEEWDRR